MTDPDGIQVPIYRMHPLSKSRPLWHTGAAMLTEIWEKVRGYDKWTKTEATVISSVPKPSGILDGGKAGKNPSATQWNAAVRIGWKDVAGEAYSEQFEVGEDSPLYQLCEGNTLYIRVNPKRPTQFYVPGLIESNVLAVWKAALTITMVLLLIIGFFLPEILRVISK